jgi:hypothetical protein
MQSFQRTPKLCCKSAANTNMFCESTKPIPSVISYNTATTGRYHSLTSSIRIDFNPSFNQWLPPNPSKATLLLNMSHLICTPIFSAPLHNKLNWLSRSQKIIFMLSLLRHVYKL